MIHRPGWAKIHAGSGRPQLLLGENGGHLFCLNMSEHRAQRCLMVYHMYIYIHINIYIYINTSSTAQGGGGSFKNRKPIGEVSFCESGMAKRIH